MKMLDLILFTSFLLEMCLHWLPFLWRLRRFVAILLVGMIGYASLGIFFGQPRLITLGLLITGIFRLINMARIIKGRMHADYLNRVTRRSGWIVGLVQLIFLGLYVWQPVLPYTRQRALIFIGLSQVAVALLVLLVTLRNIRKTRHIPNRHHFSDKELPTVTVAVPARNETTDLETCLKSILANDYPKLEVIVLDDCSQDRTAEIIKSFAHDGVRFVKGDVPHQRWLAKNQAYDRLLHEATGELILFCGVDVRFGPHAIKALVTTLINRKKSMISVMPLRFYSKLETAFVQPMRYWWELALPRRLFNRPPVLSTCWLAERKALKRIGGFSAVSHTIIPEGYFAREFVKNDAYSFIRADQELDVQTVKSLQEQQATTIRTHYPQLRRRLESVMILTAIGALFLLGPFALVFIGLLALNIKLAIVGAVAATLLVMAHIAIMQVSNPANVPIAFVNMPVVILTEIILGYVSMFKYEFGTVEWKDRNICVPVMHVLPRLPVLEDN